MQALEKQQLTSLLNEDLALELRAVLQKMNHTGTYFHLTEAAEEQEEVRLLHKRVDHIMALTEQLRRLGKQPTSQVSPLHLGHTTRTATSEDLAIEYLLKDRYQNRADQANRLALNELQDILAMRLQLAQDTIRSLKQGEGD